MEIESGVSPVGLDQSVELRTIFVMMLTCVSVYINDGLWLSRRYINPSENKGVAIMALGEGWHNYHHVFPWDYKTAELGDYSANTTTAFIDFFSKIGWAYDLKTVSNDMIKRRAQRTGDGSHPVWGWNDKDLPTEDVHEAIIMNKKDE